VVLIGEGRDWKQQSTANEGERGGSTTRSHLLLLTCTSRAYCVPVRTAAANTVEWISPCFSCDRPGGAYSKVGEGSA